VRHLLLQLETPLDTVTTYAQAARAQGVQVVLNAAPAQPLPPALLAAVDVLVVNEGELASVAQHSGSVAECLARLGTACVVVTLGHRGCCARLDGQILLQPAYPVTPVDTTAAGDSFCGALTAALAQGHSLAQALQYGSAAGALACTRPGAQASIPTHAEVQALVASSAPATTTDSHALRSYCGF
jgi:ribokinase